jgi:hypothetical protein
LTKAEYDREYRQARRETARLVISGKGKIHKEYVRVFSRIARVIRENNHKPFLEEQIRSAFPKQELFDFLKKHILEGRGKAVKLMTDIDRRYILEALDRVPGHGLSKEKIRLLFDGIADKHKQGTGPATSPMAVLLLGANTTCGHTHSVVKNARSKTYQGQASGEPLQYTFHQSYSLSKSVWNIVGETEDKILDVVWGGISQGRDVRTVAADLMEYIKGGPDVVKGRWGKLKPETREYAKRLGSKGVDYRALRLYRSEIHRHQQEAAVEEGEDNPACTGEYDWILMPGREVWFCGCDELAKGGPYTKETIPPYPHPNCDCQVRPRLKDGNEFMQQLLDYVHERDTPGARKIEAWVDTYELGDGSTHKSTGTDLDRKLQDAINYGVHNEYDARRIGKLALAKAQRDGKELYDVLVEYRDFGAMDAYGTSYTHTWEKDSEEKEIQRLEGAYTCYPTDWIALSIEEAKKHPLLVQKVTGGYDDDRGYYDHYGTDNDKKHKGHPTLKLDDSVSVPAHEFAHRMEYIIPNILELEKEFYNRRTKGYPLIRINTIKGFEKYPDDEKTKIDKFNHPYMGKDYHGRAYEILSTGMEKLFYRQYNNKLDKDFDSFIIGLLLGVRYVRYNRKNRKRDMFYPF